MRIEYTGGHEPYVPEVWRVVGKTQETADTATLTLEPPPGAAGFRFAPGQFNMLYVYGCGEAAISISGDPGEEGRLRHTVRAVGSVTRPLAALKPGQSIGVRGPYGRPWPVGIARGKNVVIVAGGLGLAPLRSAILAILRERAAYRRLTILYGARNPENLIYRQEIAGWRARQDTDVRITVDHADPEWRGDVGVILSLIRAAEIDPADTVALVCGPEVMMDLAADALIERGLPQESVFVSLERNMKCAFARCGHCQFGPHFLCADGPVFAYNRVRPLLGVAEI